MGAIVRLLLYSFAHGEEKKRFFALLGSNWNNSVKARSFYLNLNNTASNRNRNLSSRLEHAVKNK